MLNEALSLVNKRCKFAHIITEPFLIILNLYAADKANQPDGVTGKQIQHSAHSAKLVITFYRRDTLSNPANILGSVDISDIIRAGVGIIRSVIAPYKAKCHARPNLVVQRENTLGKEFTPLPLCQYDEKK